MAVSDALLERESELETLVQVLSAAQAGRGQVVLVEGPPGVGKTRLLDAARELAEAAGVNVLAARGAELERDLPFGVAQQLLEPPVELLGAASTDRAADDRSLALIECLREELLGRVFPHAGDAAAESFLLLVDDAQWADPPSLRLLCHLALRLAQLPVAIVVAVRSGDPGGPADLLDALRANPVARIVRPEPLTGAAVERLVRAGVGDADTRLIEACTRVTGGNPFYLRELVRLLASMGAAASVHAVEDAAPETVLRAVMARLARLGSAPTELAEAVAVLGDGCPLAIAAALAGLPTAAAEAAADELARASILDAGEPLRFTHPLIASTLYSDLGAFARARSHRRAAELLVQAAANPDRIAAHLLQSRPDGDADVVERLRATAARSRTRGEPGTAVRLLSRALDEPPAGATRVDVLVELAAAEALVGSPAAEAHLEAALAATADPRRRAEVCAALARTLQVSGQPARAAEIADRARREVPAADPLAEHLLAAWVAPAILIEALHERVGGELAPFIADARRGALPAAPELCALIAAWLTFAGERGATVRALAEAAFAAGPLVDADARGIALGYAAGALVGADALESAEPLLGAAIDAAGGRGATVAIAIARSFRARVRHGRGRLADAISDAELVLEVHAYGWIPSPWTAPILIQCHVERGDLDAAAAVLAIGTGADLRGPERIALLEARACLRQAQGRADEALADAREAGRILEQVYGRLRDSPLSDWSRLAALAARTAGREDEAAELAARSLALARAGGRDARLGAALAAAGVVAGGADGLGLLREAGAVFAELPPRLEGARVLLELGAALRRSGRRTEAKGTLYRALELADGFGAAPLAERARAELGSLGLRPRRAAQAGVAGLTPAERRVADLAASGLSTPRIAHALSVTTKTVESHLGQVYRKLEIAGRGELASALPA
ncbi:MAG TPA: AAA family ATPase [Solirubrobacteraceae bacterium]|nr:AAA family ATPase [Solirubrobacteraceae bacterium]